jgi:gluconate 5-dehydrogenase
MYHPFSLEGRTALIAGASRGIGLAIAEAVARSGADAILAARNVEALETAAAKLRQEGCRARALRLDVADVHSIENVVADLPDIDILHNVAGINIRKRFLDYTREEYDRVLNTNLHGIVELTQRVGRKMVERGKGGKIVMIGSLQSVVGLPFLAPYAMSKSALWGLTRVLAAEWGKHNIQVNCIAPGFIVTDLNRAMWQSPALNEWLKGVQALPRTGTPEDVAALAVFLSSRGSDYITGQCIAVDGGYTTTAVWPFEP